LLIDSAAGMNVARRNPQMDDVNLFPCPHCGKLIVLAHPNHKCKKLVPEKEYISKEVRVTLRWLDKVGWQLLWWPEYIWVEDITVIDVFNWINNKPAQFKPVLPEEIDNV